MKLFEGKTPSERNKIIVALVLGVLSVLAIGNLIFTPFSSSKKITVTLSPTPSASPTPNRTGGDTVVNALPRQNEIDDIYTRIPVSVQYPPGAGDPGRNIFAFYEPPVPTPFSPTPIPEPKTPKPTPIVTPTPPNVYFSFINRQSAYAGEKGFKLEVGGDKFTPETTIWFNGTPLPTQYISPQQMTAEVPANYISAAGQRNVEVRSADGRLFSNPIIFNVMQPPLPQFSYKGPVRKKFGNNDSAYILEPGSPAEVSKRIGDIIGGRFRLFRISRDNIVVKDINLGFEYTVEAAKGAGQSTSTTTINRPTNPNFPDPSMVQPTNPNNPNCPPGIPCNNIRPYQTPQPKKDDDDVDDDGDN
jgi:hypothetical protein